MSKIRHILKNLPHKPCEQLSDAELIDEEARCRRELVRLVLSLTFHIGTCTTHGVLSAGTTLPFHVPVVVFIAYSLTRTARRHRALKAFVKQHRRNLIFKKLPAKRFAAPVVLAILSPILSALGADIINEIVCTVAGSDTILSCNVGSSNSVAMGDFQACDQSDSDFKIVTASGDDCSGEFSLSEEASKVAIEELLQRWQDNLVRGVSDEFAELVAVIGAEERSRGANVAVPAHYKVHCNACHKQISNGYSCTECHDLDLCRQCYTSVRIADVKSHAYTEFKVEEEITQIQRIMSSLRRESVVIESRRGGFTHCNKCSSRITAPTSRSRKDELVFYYNCKDCHDFDICSKCFPEEAPSPVHQNHTFSMIVATDDQETISRLSSPTQSRMTPKLSPRPSSTLSPQTATYLPRSPRSPRSPHSPGSSGRSPDSASYISRTGSSTSSSRDSASFPMTPLFSPGYSPFVPSDSKGHDAPPAYSAIGGQEDWPSGKSYWCDACHTAITGNERLTCADAVCLKNGSGVDLHVECVEWPQRAEHSMRLVSRAAAY